MRAALLVHVQAPMVGGDVVPHTFVIQTVSVKTLCIVQVGREYGGEVPRLWSDTIEAHRRDVHHAIMERTVELVGEHGLRAVTMSQVAESVGIGRATLYKYFPSVEAILEAWHLRVVTAHVEQLRELAARRGAAVERLRAVLEAYGSIERERHHAELAAVVRHGDQVDAARRQLHAVLRGLIAEAAAQGDARDDVPPGELAAYCMHALTASGSVASQAAVRRLVAVILDGIAHRH